MQGLGQDELFAMLTGEKFESPPPEKNDKNSIMQPEGQEEDFFARLTSGKREALPSDNKKSNGMQVQGQEEDFFARLTSGKREALPSEQHNINSIQEQDFFARLTSGKREALHSEQHNINSIQEHGQETFFIRWGESFPVDNNSSIVMQAQGKEKLAAMPTRGWGESLRSQQQNSNSLPDVKMQQLLQGDYRSGRDESGDSDMDDDNDDNDCDGGEEETKAQREQSGTDYRLNFEATPFDNWLSDFDERVAEAMKNDPLLLFVKLSLEDDDHKTGPQIEKEVIGTAKTEEERDGKEKKEGDSEKEQAKRKKEQWEAAMRKKLKETPPDVQCLKNPPIAQASAKAFLGKEDD